MSSYRGVAVALLAAAVLAGCSSGDKVDSAKEQQNGPSLNGTYRLDFDASKRTALGKLSPGNESFSRKWAFRSHCGDSGCVATATRLNNDGSGSNTRTTLDFLDGKWVMVFGEDSKCNASGAPARVLGTWVLEPQPDNTLTGTWTEITTGDNCPWVQQMPLKVSREGDAPNGVDVTDPATLPARTPSKPEGFRGAYTQTVTARPPEAEPGIANLDVMTYCVRNTDECASTQAKFEGDGTVGQITPLTFVGDRWSFKFNRPDRTCEDGSPMTSVLFDEVMLPDPVSNPMEHLIGTRVIQIMDPCPGEQVFDLVYQHSDTPAPAAPAPEPAPTPAPVPPPEPVPAPGG